jgi:hypothetical protein
MHGSPCDMLAPVIESFVDLTYRGLALGRRIKLTEVRPSTAFVELAAPMPVGTALAIVTDDGLALEATVTWIHEQVAGAERAPGMLVTPVLTADTAAAWWRERVMLPDDDQPRPRPSRSRPVTLRPRSNTERSKPTTDRSPPPEHVITDEVPTMMTAPPIASAADGDGPTIVADLAARVAAAAGLDLPRPALDSVEINERPTVAMPALDQSRLAQATMRSTGQHDVVDDGKPTMIMEAIDPATLGLDLPSNPEAPAPAIGDEPSAPVITIETSDDEDDAGDSMPNLGTPEVSDGTDKPAAGKGKRRRKRR